MQSGHSRHHRPYSQQGPYNPEHDHEPHHPYRFYIKAEPSSNKRTPTTKNSLDKQHRSTKQLHRKQEVTHDVSTHFTQNLRERRIKSNSKNRTENSDTEGNTYDQHFGRITMHCLRKRREIFQKDAHSLQSEYSYLLKKIQKLQKGKQSEQSKQQHKQLIQFKRKRELSSLQIVKASNDSLLMRRKEELKGQVLSHRANKAQNVMILREQKLRAGDEQRMQESHLHEELIHIHESRFQQNKVKCQRGKGEKLRRQRRMKSELEEKRIAAKQGFRHRWIDEYEREEAAKEEYRQKKEEFERKIREAIDVYKEIEGQ